MESVSAVVSEELRVEKIRDGTVIDHIDAGTALAVLRILGITGREGYVVSLLMNVSSKKLGKKDMVKVEGRELSPTEVQEIALVAPNATINIIRNFKVLRKERVKPPDLVKDLLKCPNPACVTNSPEPVKAVFHVEVSDGVTLRCYHCGILMEKEDILKQF